MDRFMKVALVTVAAVALVACGSTSFNTTWTAPDAGRLSLDDGTKVEADKSYVVAGWATVGSQSPGEPIWETVAKYLRDVKTVKIEKLNTPVLKNASGNPGIAEYPRMG